MPVVTPAPMLAEFVAGLTLADMPTVLPHEQTERIRDTVLTLERGSAAKLAAVLCANDKMETDR